MTRRLRRTSTSFALCLFLALAMVHHAVRAIPEVSRTSNRPRPSAFANQKPSDTATAAASLSVATSYLHEGNYPEALKYFLHALKIYEAANDLSGIASCHRSIGFIFIEQGNYVEAIKNLQISKDTYVTLKDDKGLARCELNIGYLYENQGRYREAVEHYGLNLAIARRLNDSLSVAAACLQLGSVYMKEGDYPKALEMEFAALHQYEKAGRPLDIASAYGTIANVYSKQKKVELARTFLLKGLVLAQRAGSLPNAMIFYKDLSELEAAQLQYKSALEYYKKFEEIRDSLLNTEKSQEVSRLKMQYDYDKKEAYEKAMQLMKDEINGRELQRQKLLRNGFILGFSIVLISALGFFLQRNRIRKEKRRSDSLLLNILPAKVAAELKERGVAPAKHFDDVTVMFADIKGFTGIAGKLTPSQLVTTIDSLFKAFDTITGKYGIEKIKTIGDCYMCAGGIPEPTATHARDVVIAALEIQEFMQRFDPLPQQAGGERLQIRIGIHTGPVVAGVVGSKKFAYDIWGDTVNTAAGMEAGGEPGQVNISGATYERIKHLVECKYRGKLDVKSKGAIDMYFVSGTSIEVR